MEQKIKYVKDRYGNAITFPEVIEHSRFQYIMDIVSAGFCVFNHHEKSVVCYGRSVSLDIKSKPNEDSIDLTKQYFGLEAANNVCAIINNKK